MFDLLISILRTGVRRGISRDSVDGRDLKGRTGCDIAPETDKEPQISQFSNTY